MNQYPEHKQLNLPEIDQNILKFWDDNKIFERSISEREGAQSFVFYEGPPSANGMPGIHHVMARAIKDIFCRYKTMQGFQVTRKAGWDTHGLPIELGVEKTLGITKEDIGKKISVEDYNKKCREEVMKYTDKWEEVTRIMGYWVNMKDPYITYENNYIQSLWWILKELYKKDYLYKGLSIQPYSPAAGTGLSSHEINQPGCYRDVKDTSATVMFKIINKNLPTAALDDAYFLAWTTTPWTLPSNTALCVAPKVEYQIVSTISLFTHQPIKVVLAKALVAKHFKPEMENVEFSNYKIGDKNAPYQLLDCVMGNTLVGINYQQLLPFEVNSKENLEGPNEAWRVIGDGFVTTDDGTGIVHIAPSFGADDFRVAKQNNIGALTMVDKRGKNLAGIKDDVFLYGDEFVKEAYLSDLEKQTAYHHQKNILENAGKLKDLKQYISVDTRIVLKLQEEGKLFKKEIYEHSYPHCWRTDKPIIYYPLDSWFIAVTKAKEKMIALNKTINWKPEATGTGRFGNWLENANDWNLSRSRFWGTPLPIWRTEDGAEEIIIGSIAELTEAYQMALNAGFNKEKPLAIIDGVLNVDLHKPYVDDIILCSKSGKHMVREADLIDVWFDSGAMPLAQWGYPFANDEKYIKNATADFIAEGVDQTRGWFYTLHAISTMLRGEVAYKNVISNGLVLDKNGNKMSKRLGNAVDPFEAIPKYGADAIRWYMVENANPWDNLKFDFNGITETQRKFFGTLYNTYGFFALYANIDKFKYEEQDIPINERPEIDRWIISLLNTLIADTTAAYNEYEPTKAARAIQVFVDENLSNWYIRLCRRRFWKGEPSKDKTAAYQTLYICLETIAQLMSPIAPFFGEWLFRNLNNVSAKIEGINAKPCESVHLSLFPKHQLHNVDKKLEERMQMAQDISSLVLSLRKKANIKVRQPLGKIIIPILNSSFQAQLILVQDLILSEVNVKELALITETEGVISKKIKANFKTLGAKLGKNMKEGAALIAAFTQHQILALEQSGLATIQINSNPVVIQLEDVEITAEDIPGWQVASKGALTVALDTSISNELLQEGIAREIVNQIQKIRKESDFKVTDKIKIDFQKNELVVEALKNYNEYICSEVLALEIILHDDLKSDLFIEINEITIPIKVSI
jgi:isoleucyl-tRNA synthetase